MSHLTIQMLSLKRLLAASYLFFCFIPANSVLSQKFIPDENGHVPGTTFQQLIKQRGYQLVASFDTTGYRKHSGPTAAVQKNEAWGTIDIAGKELVKPGAPASGSHKNKTISPHLVDVSDVDIERDMPSVEGPPGEDFYTPNLQYQKIYSSKTDTYGLMRAKDSSITLPANYEYIQFFTNDFALVRQNRQYGIVSPTGKPLAPFQYEMLSPVYDNSRYLPGIVIYTRDGKKGLMYIDGREITAPEYEQITGTNNMNVLKIIKAKKEGLMRPDGTLLAPCDFIFIHRFSSSGVTVCRIAEQAIETNGLIDTAGHLMPLPGIDHVWEMDQLHGIFTIMKGTKMGLANSHGRMVLDPVYDGVLPDSTGSVIVFEGTGSQKIYGLADTAGQMIVAPRFSKLRDFSRHLAVYGTPAAGKPGKILLGLIEKQTGKLVVAEKYAYVGDLRRNLARVTLAENNLQGYIDAAGVEVIPAIYSEIGDLFSSRSIAPCTYNGKKGLINASGQLVLPAAYDWLDAWGTLLHATKDGRHGIIDSAGTVVIPFEYQHIIPAYLYEYGRPPQSFLAKKDGLWGLMRIDGSVAIPFTYERLMPSRYPGQLIYALQGKYGLLTDTGKKITEALYSKITPIENAFVVTLNEKQGIISRTGKSLIPAKYDDFGDWFMSGVIEAWQNGRRCRVHFYGNTYFF